MLPYKIIINIIKHDFKLFLNQRIKTSTSSFLFSKNTEYLDFNLLIVIINTRTCTMCHSLF